jgi:uncharacterized membrane protein
MARSSEEENDMARRIILFASLFFVALTSGGAFVVYLAYNPAGMSAAFYVETMQHAIRSLMPLAVVLNLGLLFTIVSAILARHERLSLYVLIAASMCIITALLFTVFGNWPINHQIITWSSNSPPSNWTELRDQWWRFHVARAVMIIGGLSLLILVPLIPRNTSK